MLWFNEYGAQWILKATYRTLVILLLSLTSCATVPSSRKFVGTALDSKRTVQPEEPFSGLWEKWTVQLGAAARRGMPLQLLNPFSTIGGMNPGGGESQFPLQITATLMDSTLIEAGLKHYSALIAMTPGEDSEFRSKYLRHYDVENHLLIWCKLDTYQAELYLDLNRWTIFIQDDAGNRYEPLRILEEAQSFSPRVTDRFPEFQPEQKGPEWKIHQKNVMLCFPKRDFYNNPILSERVRFLKLVFQQSEDEKTRAEGMWVFRE